MRSRCLPVGCTAAMVLALTACAHPVQKRLEGRWHGAGVENVDDSLVAVATGWAKGTAVEFAGSTITITVPAEEPRSAPYEVVAVEPGAVTLSIKSEGGDEKARFYLDGKRTMRWDIGGGRSVLLRREL